MGPSDRLVVPVVWRPLDGCARGCLPTYAENLRHINRVTDCLAAEPVTASYAVYLARVNAEVDLEARHRGPAIGDLRGAGVRVTSEAQRAEGAETPVKPAAGLPRLGDVPPVAEVVRQAVVQETYQVRNLLSRGAIIDLVG